MISPESGRFLIFFPFFSKMVSNFLLSLYVNTVNFVCWSCILQPCWICCSFLGIFSDSLPGCQMWESPQGAKTANEPHAFPRLYPHYQRFFRVPWCQGLHPLKRPWAGQPGTCPLSLSSLARKNRGYESWYDFCTRAETKDSCTSTYCVLDSDWCPRRLLEVGGGRVGPTPWLRKVLCSIPLPSFWVHHSHSLHSSHLPGETVERKNKEKKEEEGRVDLISRPNIRAAEIHQPNRSIEEGKKGEVILCV